MMYGYGRPHSSDGNGPYPPFVPPGIPPPHPAGSWQPMHLVNSPPPNLPLNLERPWQGTCFPPLPMPFSSWPPPYPPPPLTPVPVRTVPPYHPHVSGDQPVNKEQQGKQQQPTQEADESWSKDSAENSRSQQRAKRRKKRRQGITLSDGAQLHRRAYSIISDLESMKTSEEQDQEFLGQLNSLKTELDGILKTLSDKTVMEGLKTQAERRKKRRAKTRELRKKLYLDTAKAKKHQEEKKIEVEKWILNCREEERRSSREKEVQKQLDQYLQEVRSKRVKLKKELELIAALSKLRKARRDSATKSIAKSSEEDDKNFLEAHKFVKDHVTAKLADCQEEENRLVLFVDAERKKQEEELNRQKLKEEEEKRKRWNDARWQVLFGQEEDLDEFDPMWPVQQLHKQADSSLLGLVAVRQQWDQFIVTDPNEGSRIPLGWVEPVPPSSDEWRDFLAEKTLTEEF